MHLTLLISGFLVCLLAAAVGDELRITANNYIQQVCIDGKRSKLGRQSRNKYKMDKYRLPSGWSGVNILAKNKKAKAGLLGYIRTGKFIQVGIHWSCKLQKNVPNRNCCGWNGVGGYKNWFRRVFAPYNRLVPASYPRAWVWSNPHWKTVCCRAAACSPLCRKCRHSGPGKCDRCWAGTTIDWSTNYCCKRCEIQYKSGTLISYDAYTKRYKSWQLTANKHNRAFINPKNCNFVKRVVNDGSTQHLADDNLGTKYLRYIVVSIDNNPNPFYDGVFTIFNMTGNGLGVGTVKIGPLTKFSFNTRYCVSPGWGIGKADVNAVKIAATSS